MNRRLALLVTAAVVLALFGSVFVVREGQAAIVLNLGKVVRSDLAPRACTSSGRWSKAGGVRPPPAGAAADPERYLTSERKDVSVDFFAIGRIQNVRDFYRATGGDGRRRATAAPIIKDGCAGEINAARRRVSGDAEFSKMLAARLASVNQGAATLGCASRHPDRASTCPPTAVDPRCQTTRMRAQRSRWPASCARRRPEQANGSGRPTAQQAVILAEAGATREAARRRAMAAAHLWRGRRRTRGFYAFQRSLEAYRKAFSAATT